MKTKKTAIKNVKYDPYKMSTIIERMSALNTLTEARDFGTGEKYYTAEIHIMSYIADNPGITVTELARAWNRTKGAISQIIKKLEYKELVYRTKENGNHKNVCLYVTNKGMTLNNAHREYDNKTYAYFYEKLQAYYSGEKLQELFEMLEKWIELLVNDEA